MADSVLLAGEAVAAWKHRGTTSFLWEVDFSKAYDSLDWRFHWVMLPRKGFPEDWIRWVKQCITTHSFSTLVDGRPVGGWIHPQWGVRQGCPLAPLLFVLAADVLATCTQQLCCRGLLQGFQTSSQQTGIPLLQYADDTLFLIEGSSEAAQNMSTLLDIFSNFLGLRLNRAKSTVVTCGMPKEVAGRVSTILATPRESLPIRYLGLPLSAGRVLVRDWQPMIEKVEQRLEGWKSCMLSWGGRLVLNKAVLSAIPTYFLSIFRAPRTIRNKLTASMRRFFWRGARPGGAPGVALVDWKLACRPP